MFTFFTSLLSSYFPRHTMRFQTSKPHLTKPWKQPSQCKMQAWITKHNGKAHAIFQRSPPRGADNGNRSSAARAQTAPVAHTRFPPSTPGATLCKNVQGFRAISNIQASPLKALEAAIPMQKASLDHQTQWHSACNLSKITSAQRWQWGPLAPSTGANRTRRTDEVPIDAGSHFMQEHSGFRAIFLASKPHLRKPWTQPFQRKVRFTLTSKHHPSKRWKQPFQCKMPAWITKHNGTAHAIFQRSPLRGADNWNRPSAAWAQTDTSHTDEVLAIDAGSHFMRENIGFRVISNIQTSPGDSCSTTICNQRHANHTTAASTTSLLFNFTSGLSTSLPPHIPTLSISNLCTSLFPPSRISPHL